MANKREIAKIERNLLNGLTEDKEQVKIALKVFREFFSDCNTRGMSVVDIKVKTSGSNTLVFEIEQWAEEKPQNTFDYTFVVVNGNGEVILDRADGELPFPLVLDRFEEAKRYLNVFLV